MIQNIDPFLNKSVKMSPSEEELELFNAYRQQLYGSFLLFRQGNLALTSQEKELKKLKIDMELKFEKFDRERDACKKVLDDIRKDIAIERSTLRDIRQTF